MIQTLQNTICTAILYLAIALVGAYLISRAPDVANHLVEPTQESIAHASR